MIWNKALLMSALLFFLPGCKHAEPAQNSIEKAEMLINERNFTDAIAILEGESSKDKSGRATLLLATAYAGSAGINLIDGYSFFTGFLLNKSNSATRSASKKPESIQGDRLLALSQLTQTFLLTIASSTKLFLSVPYLNPSNRSKLVEAILLTEKIKRDQTYYVRNRQYLMFLNLIQFGNFFKDLFPKVDFAQDLTSIDLICGLEANSFLQNFQSAITSFSQALIALEDIKDEKSIKVQGRIEDLRRTVDSMQKINQDRQLSFQDSVAILTGIQQGLCE